MCDCKVCDEGRMFKQKERKFLNEIYCRLEALETDTEVVWAWLGAGF